MPATKAPAKKAASKKKASKKKNADSDEDEYVPEKEEPDEALDVKLEEEAGDVEPAEDDEGEDEDEEELVPKRKGGKQARASKARKKREPKGPGRTIVRVDPVTLEHTRVLDTHVELDTESSEFQMQLVEFLESGKCPKCQSTLKRAHARHLKLCVLIGRDECAVLFRRVLFSPDASFVPDTGAGVPQKTLSGETTKGRSWRHCRQRHAPGKLRTPRR